MDDAVCVRERHGLAHSQKEAQPLRKRREPGESRVETLPLDELHRIEGAAVREPARVVDGYEAGMLEPREDPRLAEKRLGRGLAVERHVDDLERETPLQHLVLDFEDGAHAASSDRPDEAIARAGEIRSPHGFAQPVELRVLQPHVGGSAPRRARASARNSASEMVSSRRRSSTTRRNSRRAAASWFVTSTGVVSNRRARSS